MLKNFSIHSAEKPLSVRKCHVLFVFNVSVTHIPIINVNHFNIENIDYYSTKQSLIISEQLIMNYIKSLMKSWLLFLFTVNKYQLVIMLYIRVELG